MTICSGSALYDALLGTNDENIFNTPFVNLNDAVTVTHPALNRCQEATASDKQLKIAPDIDVQEEGSPMRQAMVNVANQMA